MKNYKGLNCAIAMGLMVLIAGGCTCNREKEPVVEKPAIDSPVTVKINRYDKALFSVSRNRFRDGLAELKKDYPFFLDGDLNDSVNINQLRQYLDDPQIKENFLECSKQFADLQGLEKQLSELMTYYHHYFPEKKIPKVYSYISGMDFERPVKFADSVLIIALDMYLGSNYPLYSLMNLPLYSRRTMTPEYISRDCAEEMAYFYCYSEVQDPTYLDYMVHSGKILFFMDALLPDVHDTLKIRYTGAQLDWCRDNEEKVWSFFISNKLLYSKDTRSWQKFLVNGPFTTNFGKESAPRTGEWIGWQIVRAYMKNNRDVGLRKLILEKDSQKILSKSTYKPSK